MTDSFPRPDDGIRSRQVQIAANIRQQILSGEIKAGDKLPSTARLMREYGVSNLTVQRALAILKNEQLVRGDKGRGVFVTAHQPIVVEARHYPAPVADGDAYPWVSEAARRGRRRSTTLLEVAEVVAPPMVADAYGIGPGALTVLRKQLLSLDGEPAELVRNYYRLEIARGTPLSERKPMKGGSPRVLTELGKAPGPAVDDLGASIATVEEFMALQLPEDMPVLRQFRVVYTVEGEPVEVTEMVQAAHQYKARYFLPGPEQQAARISR